MNIVKKLSPNHFKGRNGWKPDMIVNHITEGSYDGSINWLCNPRSQASAHFVVAKDGRITQLVELTDGAWGNGTSKNPLKKYHYSKSTLKSVRDRKTNANYYTISIEHEGIWANGKGKLTPAQLQATIELHKYIIAEVKRIYGVDIPIDREHIVGHYQITPITKPLCPGVNFQWDELIKALSPVEKKVAEPIKTGKVNSRLGLNVRKGPGTGYAKVTALPCNAQVKIYAEDKGWYNIGTGWVSAKYVTISGTPAPTPQRVYVVQPGDSLWKIAAKPTVYKNGLKWGQLAKLNNIKWPYTINVGQKLKF